MLDISDVRRTLRDTLPIHLIRLRRLMMLRCETELMADRCFIGDQRLGCHIFVADLLRLGLHELADRPCRLRHVRCH